METVEAFGLEEEDDSSEDGTFDEDELADEPAHEPEQAPVFHTLQNVDYNQKLMTFFKLSMEMRFHL